MGLQDILRAAKHFGTAAPKKSKIATQERRRLPTIIEHFKFPTLDTTLHMKGSHFMPIETVRVKGRILRGTAVVVLAMLWTAAAALHGDESQSTKNSPPRSPQKSPQNTIAPRAFVPPDSKTDGVGQLPLTPSISPAVSEYCGDGAPIVSKLPVEYDAGLVAAIVAAAKSRGDARRGAEVFCSTKFGCLSCHRVGKFGGSIGPPLADIGRRAKPEEIVESVLWPKRQVKPEYSSWRISLDDGRSLQGYKRGEMPDAIQLLDPMTGKTRRIVKTEIADQRELGTLMPDGVAGGMTSTQRSDLARFLMELGRTSGLEGEVRPETMPAEFSYERGPLIPEDWPLWQEHVNRDRVYDFYRKEALFFRGRANLPRLLPEFPGLDGGKFGHWGNQNEATWTDGRWTQTDLGTVLSGVFHGPDITVPKAVCVRLGQHGELAACFNPETLSYEAVWRGGFLKLSAVRHGFVDGLRPDGDLLPRPPRKRLDKPFVYHGFYRSGLRVVFAYRLGDVEMLDAPWVKDGKFKSVVAPVGEHPLREVLHGGPAQWPQEIKTVAELGAGRPYAVDTIRPPFDNPWKAPLFFGDHDFLPDGSALLCTMEGDVWRVTGLDTELKNVRWRRFASGLNQPLGLVVAEGQVYVLGRDQITRLHDLNGDGEADFYECFSNKMITSPAGHDFTCGLARDPQGRFYTASGKQGLIRISADGQKVDVLATGFRNPDGVGLCDDGAVTVPCSEGDWTPASMICLVKPDPSAASRRTSATAVRKIGKLPALPFAYLPRGLDNSSGGQVDGARRPLGAATRPDDSFLVRPGEPFSGVARRSGGAAARSGDPAGRRFSFRRASRTVQSQRWPTLCLRHEWLGILHSRRRLLRARALHGRSGAVAAEFSYS